jgi:hypothetical protein
MVSNKEITAKAAVKLIRRHLASGSIIHRGFKGKKDKKKIIGKLLYFGPAVRHDEIFDGERMQIKNRGKQINNRIVYIQYINPQDRALVFNGLLDFLDRQISFKPCVRMIKKGFVHGNFSVI